MNRKLANHSTKQFQTTIQLENEKMLSRLLHVKPSLKEVL